MAAYSKYEIFPEYLTSLLMTLFGTAGAGADTCNVALSNQTPAPTTDVILADVGEITPGAGYSAGGASVANAGTRSGGTFTLNGTNVTFTASGGAIGPFQYVILFDDTVGSPVDPLIAYWDLGLAITLNDGASLELKFNGGVANGTIFTLA